MELVAIVKEAWGWIGLDPHEIVGGNDFGNLMIKDHAGRYWRLCPEDLSCDVVAGSRSELDALSRDQEFLHDWYMTRLVEQARERLGPFVVELPPALDQHLRLGPAAEPFAVEQLIAQLAVEAFDEAVLPRAAWRD